MAKKKKQNAAEDSAPAQDKQTEIPRDALECERLFAQGNSAAARRSATAVLASGDAAQRERAQAVLDMVKPDWQPWAVWGGLFLVLVVVFLNAIVARNDTLKDVGPALDLNKALIRVEPTRAPSETVPAQAPAEGNRGAP
jgi:hypothetical protein